MSTSEGGSSEGREGKMSRWEKLLRTGAPAYAATIAGPSFMSGAELANAIVVATPPRATTTPESKKNNKIYASKSVSTVALPKTTKKLGASASAVELTRDDSSKLANANLPPLPFPLGRASLDHPNGEMSNKHAFGIPAAQASLWPADAYYFAKNSNVRASSLSINNPSSSSSSLSSGRRSSATPVEMHSSSSHNASRPGRAVPLVRAASSGSSFRKRSSDYSSTAVAGPTTLNNQNIQPVQIVQTGQTAHHTSPALFPLAPPPKSKRRPATAVASVGRTSSASASASVSIGSKPPATAVPMTSVESLSGTPTAGSHSDHAVPFASENKQRQPSFSVTSPRHSDMIRKYFKPKNGKRHHAFPSKRAPYPRSYDSAAIDHDTASHLFFTSLCKSLTWHEFPSPPKRVLDLGCGNGVWILDCAQLWPDTHFIGLDLVPLQPDLALVAPHLMDRVTWMNANFLERLAFPDDHFDFVHIRRIARGVPENKWHFLLEEVSRVLTPDGALEVIEEDLVFPGGSEPCTCHHPPHKADGTTDRLEPASLPIEPREEHGSPPETPMPTTAGFLDYGGDPESPHYYSPLISMRDHSRLEQAYVDMHSAKFINLTPISVLTDVLAHYFRDVRSHPPLFITFPPPEEDMWGSGSESGGEAKSMAGKSISRPSTATSSGGYSMGSSAVGSSIDDGSFADLTPTDASLFTLTEGPENGSSSYMSHPPPGGWHTLHLDVRSLVNPKQPFIMVDRCRMPARTAGSNNISRLPNATFVLDLQSLTLHLSQSVVEVLECAEAIWEHLVESGKARAKRTPRSRSVSSVPPNADGLLDREEFDHWLTKYEKEMQYRIGMAKALRQRFGWKPKTISSSDNIPGKKEKVISRPLGSMSSAKGSTDPTGPTTGSNANSTTTRPSASSRRGEPTLQRSGLGGYTDAVISGETTASSSTSLLDDSVTVTRQRTGSAPERVSMSGHKSADKTEGHHSRAHSLDGANAWELLQEEVKGREAEEAELPRLSRCLRVFVAWNGKPFTSA